MMYTAIKALEDYLAEMTGLISPEQLLGIQSSINVLNNYKQMLDLCVHERESYHSHVGYDKRWCVSTTFNSCDTKSGSRCRITDTHARRQVENYDIEHAFNNNSITTEQLHHMACKVWGRK